MSNKLVCRVCGKEYDPCRTPKINGGFRWQDVACCSEHGAEYLDKIRKSRMPKASPAVSSVRKKKVDVESILEIKNDMVCPDNSACLEEPAVISEPNNEE